MQNKKKKEIEEKKRDIMRVKFFLQYSFSNNLMINNKFWNGAFITFCVCDFTTTR